MPSPFPGMNPYLEGELWTTFHTQLGAEVARQLTLKLAPRYLALADKRYVIDSPDDVTLLDEAIYPDVGEVQAQPTPFPAVGGTVAAAPLQMDTALVESVPHVWVEIRDTAKRDLVTAIEFLSPTNKRGDGRREYLAKRQRLLLGPAHLVEIDLLRRGRRVPMQSPLPPALYFVFISRAGKKPLTDVWPVGLDHPLPSVAVPLRAGDPEVQLDLQLAVTNVYDACRFDLLINYQQPPEVPLPPEAAAWTEERLRAAGLRP